MRFRFYFAIGLYEHVMEFICIIPVKEAREITLCETRLRIYWDRVYTIHNVMPIFVCISSFLCKHSIYNVYNTSHSQNSYIFCKRRKMKNQILQHIHAYTVHEDTHTHAQQHGTERNGTQTLFAQFKRFHFILQSFNKFSFRFCWLY